MNDNALLIGFGAIGQTVFQHANDGSSACIGSVLVREKYVDAVRTMVGESVRVVANLEELDHKPGYALECAGHGAVAEFGPRLLEIGIDFGVVSVGALTDPTLMKTLREAAHKGRCRVHVLSGAVAGIDALAAAKAGELREVIYSCRKPPPSWRGTRAEEIVELDSLRESAIIFEGNARDAARQFPQNANVAATIALAGLGFDDTKVTLVADPEAPGNLHRVEARGSFGLMKIEIAGNPLPNNPKTSTLAALSAVRALRNRVATIAI